MQRLHCFFGGVLLEESNNDIQDNHSADYSALNPRLNTEADGHSQDQHLHLTDLLDLTFDQFRDNISKRDSGLLLASLRWLPGARES